GLPGGWIADRILGQRRAVLYGGIVIACGHFSMAVPGLATFYLGLALIVIGTGLLKPNISTMVGELYGPNDHRRDAGFSIFYMGINIGAFLSPLICGYVGETINWHWGFGLAGIGMTLGLIQYTLGGKYLGTAGLYPAPAESPAKAAAQKRSLWIGVIAAAPVFAWLWVWLGPREPSSPAKFAWGLLLVGLGFVVMVVGALRAQSGVQVSSVWLWLTYFLHTCGELCLSPVGLSAFTKLAPARVAGLMMGVWFLSTSIGDYVGGRVASFYESWSLPALFGGVAAFCIVLGLALAVFVKPMKRLMGGLN